MILALCAVLGISMVTAPGSFVGTFGLVFCCMPFFLDLLMSMRGAYLNMTEGTTTGATVEEVAAIEENFISAPENDDIREERMYEPSERLMPEALAQIEPINNLATSNWRDNAVDSSNTTEKQLIAAAMILSYFVLGGSAVQTEEMVPLGVITLGYAASSACGYFGALQMPLAKLMRVNMISVVCGLLGLGSILSGGFSITAVLLTLIHCFDAYQGAINTNNRQKIDDAFESTNPAESTREHDGPIISFFTESWKVNSFNKKNYSTCQVVQIVLFGAQLYLALIAMIGGNSPVLMSAIIAMIVAGSYSFFSPMRVSAIDAMQSNGA